jgi:hypothetical protein
LVDPFNDTSELVEPFRAAERVGIACLAGNVERSHLGTEPIDTVNEGSDISR